MIEEYFCSDCKAELERIDEETETYLYCSICDKKINRLSRLIQQSSYGDQSEYGECRGRTEWYGTVLLKNETAMDALKRYQNKAMGDKIQYAEDNEWRYYKGPGDFNVALRVRIKKLDKYTKEDIDILREKMRWKR